MKVKNFSAEEIHNKCYSGSLVLQIGPFNFAIHSPLKDVSKNIHLLYGNFTALDEQAVVDFSVSIRPPNFLRRWLRPQVSFYCDEHSPFLPLPSSQAYPLLEWGMNWCIAQTLQYLSLHAAVLEKDGTTVIMPAESGSGKSTLTALLMANDWRLLSDEMAIISTKTLAIDPISRPISLKNDSIELISKYWPDAVFGTIVDDTNKGTIGHLKPTSKSVSKIFDKVKASHIIFPKFQSDEETVIKQKNKGEAFMAVIENSFNYGILGKQGFNTLSKVVDSCDCYEFTYSSTQDAMRFFDSLTAN